MKTRIFTTILVFSCFLLQTLTVNAEKNNLITDIENLIASPLSVWTCAHRANTHEGLKGATADQVPENSIAAIQKAIQKNADIVELDLRKTSDGYYIIMHDETVDRTTNGTGTVSELTLVQIQALFLKNPDGTVTINRIPTLTEALESGNGQIYYCLDIAILSETDIASVVNIVAGKSMLNKTLFYIGSDTDKANAVVSTNSDAIVFPWVSSENDINTWSALSTRIKTVQINYETTPSLVSYARGKGIAVFSNILNTAGDTFMLENNFQKIELARTAGLQVYQTDYSEMLDYYLTNNPQPQVAIQWAVNIGPQNTVQTTSPTLSHDNNTVYFASGNEGKLYALNTVDGNERWTFNYVIGSSSAGRAGSAVVGSDGTIYFPSTQGISPDNFARLYAVNPNGTQKWMYSTGNGSNAAYISPAITKDGDIITGNTGTDGAIHLVDKTNGTKKAYTKPAGGVIGSIVVSQDNIAYGLTGNYGLVAFDLKTIDPTTLAPISKGTYKVQNENNHYSVGSPAITGNGNVIAAFNQVGGDDAAIVALNASSANISHTSYVWQYLFTPSPNTNSKMEQFGASVGADGTIYVSGHETQKIYALTPAGEIKWTYSTKENIASTPAIDSRGYLHFGGWNGNYYILKDNDNNAELIYKGNLSYNGETSSQIWSSPAIANDGSVYVSAQVTDISGISSRLYKITVLGTTAPANSYWPMKGGNAQRIGLQKKELATTSINTETNSPEGFKVFSNNNSITMITNSKGVVTVYDLFGQVALKETLDVGTHSFNLHSSQMYIVKWGNVCTKVLVK